MIISPPFLPARAAGQTDEQWLDAAMPVPPYRLGDTQSPEGSFPLSHRLAWHNGVHVQAPQAAGADLSVRAIADGRVVFASPAATPNTNVDDAQNYNAFDRPGVKTAAWTDNGCVIIEHRTTIGAAGTAETEVVFYSLYMHLSALAGQGTANELRAGQNIWRKDEVGRPGQIYGHGGQLHFEICFDAANLQRLIGHAPTWVEPALAPAVLPAPTADGRTDSIFGSLYFYLPASTPTDAGANLPASHLRATAPATTLGTPVWVKMTYDRGGCTFETFDERGARVAALPAEPDAEYNLYEWATDRHGRLPAAERAQSSPSGWYELLRFGRNIGYGSNAADRDPLPANVAHWRRIAAADGTPVWADLNAAGSFKFSDADFLPAMGWNCVDDDTSPQDQRCDSENLKRLIRDPDPNNSSRMETAELARRLGVDEVRQKLRRVFCKFPSEWEKGTVSARYEFVKDFDQFKADPNAWPRLEVHLKAISFDGLPAEYLAADWRVHPLTFLATLRKCGWLSQAESTQALPRSFVAEHHGSRTVYRAGITRAQARARIAGMHQELNRAMRKYLIETRQRQAVFMANAIVESSYFAQFYEGGRGAGARYGAWYGRGIIQITWQDNYLAYFRYLGRNTSNSSANETWRDEVETSPVARCDSAGFWWLRNHANRHATPEVANVDWQVSVCENFDWRQRLCVGRRAAETRLSNPTLDAVGRLVNTGGVNTTVRVNGLVERRDIFTHVQTVLLETAYQDDSGQAIMAPSFFVPQR